MVSPWYPFFRRLRLVLQVLQLLVGRPVGLGYGNRTLVVVSFAVPFARPEDEGWVDLAAMAMVRYLVWAAVASS
jgi:hypothetical protein